MSNINENILDGWVETNLGKLGRVITGKTPSKKNPDDWGDIIDFITPSEIDNSSKYIYNTPRKLSKQGFDRFSRMILPINSVIVTCIGSDMGKVVMNRNQALTNQQINSIVVNEKHDSDYVFYLLKYAYRVLRRNAEGSGSTMPILNKSSFESLPFVIPKDKKEQKAIAKIFTAFDDKIENLQAQNITLEQTAQTIFKEWFGKFQNQNEIPQDMTLGTLDDFIGELESGKRPKGGVGQFVNGIPSVGAENVKNLGVYDYSKTKFVPEGFFNKMNYGIAKDYDILIYKDGGTPGTFIPHFTIVGEGFPFARFCINEHVFRIQPKEDFQRFYLYNWLDSLYCRKLLQNIGGKAAIPGINATDLRVIEMLIPSEEILKQFHKVVQPMYKKLLINSKNIQTLNRTRDTLLPKLMSGKIRVNDFKD